MATHPHDFGRASALPFEVALASISSLPRPLLDRLVDRAIERLDELQPDADLEDNHDREGVDEREPEPVEGGVEPEYPIDQSCQWWVRRVMVTDL